MKKSVGIILVLCMIVCFAGCTSHMAYTYSVETGDSIKVSLDTSDGYSITAEVPFAISVKGEKQTDGTFIYGEMYQQYVEVVNSTEGAEVLDSGTKDGNTYIFWTYNGEYNYAIQVGNSNTGMILGNVVSEDSARACFERLTISVAD